MTLAPGASGAAGWARRPSPARKQAVAPERTPRPGRPGRAQAGVRGVRAPSPGGAEPHSPRPAALGPGAARCGFKSRGRDHVLGRDKSNNKGSGGGGGGGACSALRARAGGSGAQAAPGRPRWARPQGGERGLGSPEGGAPARLTSGHTPAPLSRSWAARTLRAPPPAVRSRRASLCGPSAS